MKWSVKVRVLGFLKEAGFISRASEAKYLCCEGADHILGLACGRVVAVDMVLRKVVRIDGVAQ